MAVSDKPDIIATNAFYYYDDVETAWTFYRDTLGLETVVDYGFAKILRLAESSYLTVVLAEEGMHSADEPKIVTLHLVTDELDRWHDHFLWLGREIEYEGGGGEDRPADSFVVLDAEGYRLRFVRYKPHPNHSSYVESFAGADPVMSTAGDAGNMSIRATAFSLYYNNVADIRPFFEGLFAVEPVGLLAGSPLYQLAGSGFVSLEEYAGPELTSPGENGMTLSFFTSDVQAWFARASAWPGFELRTPEVLDESGLVSVFVGYDPAGVFLEWDTFLELPENQALLDHLKLSDDY
jgi:catechol 2,3-dioxygenase-like lactoylglutathione lyase family enzyme